MAKHVFRPMEVKDLTKQTVVIDPPFKAVEKEKPVEVYTGPTADDLRREAMAFRENWEKEKTAMVEAAKVEAEAIVKEAEDRAFQEVKRKTDEAQKIKVEAEDEVQQILDSARSTAEAELADARSQVEDIRKQAHKEGFEAGHKEGWDEGKKEVERLVAQLHGIINSTLEKRQDIIEQTETQLVQLVLLISKKVVKVISENQKNVVVNNVIQALRKLKSRGDVIIKVNLQDVQLTSDNVQEFTRMVETVRSITVVEDTTVDPGGAIIETDFGEIDARISSQFNEIEEKIIELAPIKKRGGN